MAFVHDAINLVFYHFKIMKFFVLPENVKFIIFMSKESCLEKRPSTPFKKAVNRP